MKNDDKQIEVTYTAFEYDSGSIAFPCIGAGVYGYPKKEAAEIVLREIGTFKRRR